MPNIDLKAGHRKRLRERFVKCGNSAFADYELVELLLTFSIPVRDVKETSKILLSRFGSLRALLDADIDDLQSIDGVGEATAILIKLIKSMQIEYNAESIKGMKKLSSPEDVLKFADSILAGSRDEKFFVFYLDSKNRVIFYEICAEGTINQAHIYPRKIIRKAMEVNASGLIMVHNHPSGDSKPSEEDINLTKKISEIAKPLDIRVLDHLIIGKGESFSLSTHELI